MSVLIGVRRLLLLLVVGALASVAVIAVVPVGEASAAGQPSWTGNWKITSFAASKTGTSLAARQPEPDFSATYTYATTCSWTGCVAKVTAGPPSSNPTVPWPPSYRWTGARWQRDFSWQWDCWQGANQPKVWRSARSTQYFTPQSDGTMTGRWTTTISGGPCNGTVGWNMKAERVG